ncbi:GNAT family N-acetyltransferase [Actinoplanes sp. NBRC 103695]|uniref:GNAT family N-acetyltransferase n=1 Tax=Actinoplanes sp. NBRC 103695 TaxID=3032202 RepID=UPI0024A01E87|nr:GNAT family N-acetyltransferase [Actinoplanes sp. NBRC 103695]GLY95066.1 acetyltransferase [Actinoplanes sp. NBRC 103695]
MDQVRVREAEAGDAEAVLGVVRGAFAKYVPRIGREPWPMGVDYGVPIGLGFCRVAEDGGRIVGVVVLEPADGYLHLDVIAVAAGAQGRGVGGLLMERAEREAVAGGYGEIRLFTNEAMTENLGYYERRGYRETHRTLDDGFRRVFFTKSLAGDVT